jgi:hypothetical protein
MAAMLTNVWILSWAVLWGAGPVEPATVEKARQTIDFTALKLPPELTAGGTTPTSLVATGTGKCRPIADELLRQLRQLGCREIKDSASDSNTDSYVNASLEKEGFSLFLSASQSNDTVSLTLSNLGNINVADLPTPADISIVFKNRGNLLFTTKLGIAETGQLVDSALAKKGWRRYRNIDGSGPPENEFLQWSYLQRGVSLSVYVSKAPAMENKTTVQYGASMMQDDFLAPADVANLLLTDTPVSEFRVVSKLPLADVIRFYESELPPVGWKIVANKGGRQENAATLLFERPDRAMYLFFQLKEGNVSIHGQEIDPKSLLAETDTSSAEKMARSKKDEEAAKKLPTVEILIPAHATKVQWKEDHQEVKFVTKASPKQVVKEYTQSLKGAGWKDDERGGVMTEFGGSMEFDKGDASISLHLFKDVFAGSTEVTITGYQVTLAPPKDKR